MLHQIMNPLDVSVIDDAEKDLEAFREKSDRYDRTFGLTHFLGELQSDVYYAVKRAITQGPS